MSEFWSKHGLNSRSHGIFYLCILYSPMNIRSSIKKNIFCTLKIKKSITWKIYISYWKKKYVSFFFLSRTRKKNYRLIKILIANLIWNDPYTLYICNNITKCDHLSLNIRQNNRYYRFGSYRLNISSNFVDFFRTNTFCKINTLNVSENGRQATYY